MDKELLEKLGIEVTEGMSEEDIKKAVTEKIDEKDKHITELEETNKQLSEDNQALTTSVEGYKSSEEKLNKELEETKTKLSNTEGKLEQVTSMYKEQFTGSSDDEVQTRQTNKQLENDVMDKLIHCSD